MIRISSVLFYRVAADKVKVTVQSTDNTKLYVYGISVIPAGLYINIMIIDGSIRVLGIIDGSIMVLGIIDGSIRVLGIIDGSIMVLGIIDGSIRVLGIIGHKSKRVPKQVCSIGN